MGIQINGNTDIISATDGSLSIQGASGDVTGNVTGNLTGNVNATGVSTFSNIRVTGGTVSGVSTAGITTAYVNTLSGISTIDASAAISINQNLVFASGKGIDFSATANSSGTMTSELLSDYEEGTFTPTIAGTSTTGTGTYSSQLGRYTKVGNRVYFTAYIVWSAHTGTGSMLVASLPFVSNSTTSNYNSVLSYNSGVSMTAGYIMQAYVGFGVSTVTLAQVPTGGGSAINVSMDTAGEMIVTGVYEV